VTLESLILEGVAEIGLSRASSQPFYERMSNQWREEQNRCQREIDRHQDADKAYKDEIWLPFLKTYRTMCIAPDQGFRAMLEQVRSLTAAA
jgi:hypothetical protein